jgi:hypothetical protein
LIVAGGSDGRATPHTNITDRIIAAATSLTAGTCYAWNRREGRAAIHLAMLGAERALRRVTPLLEMFGVKVVGDGEQSLDRAARHRIVRPAVTAYFPGGDDRLRAPQGGNGEAP